MTNAKVNIALADDHVLLRRGLASLIGKFDDYNVVFEANNGKDFIGQLESAGIPDLALIDVNMPEMDGYATCSWLKDHYPSIKVLALSMYDNENAIIRMIKSGAKGYILKDIEPKELRAALDSLVSKGFYYSEMVTGKMIHVINNLDQPQQHMKNLVSLSTKEIDFLKLVCTELTYKEIADKMYMSPRTIDGYRDTLFGKLNMKTRIGLALYAIKNGIVTL
jgi:two-component system invasion response regulator UvrY